MKICLALVFACAICSAAAAADAGAPTFVLPVGTFNAPLPSGFCPAAGSLEATAKIIAQTDSTNLTDISFFPCADVARGDGKFDTWGMIKTPLSTLKERAGPRDALIGELAKTVNSEEGKKLLDVSEADLKTKTSLEDLFGSGFKGSTKIDALASDSNGVYFGGVSNYDDGQGGQVKVACAYSITVARDGVFSIYIFKSFENVSDVAALVGKVKAETAAFVAANGG